MASTQGSFTDITNINPCCPNVITTIPTNLNICQAFSLCTTGQWALPLFCCVRELENSKAHSAESSSLSHSRSFVCWPQYSKGCIVPKCQCPNRHSAHCRRIMPVLFRFGFVQNKFAEITTSNLCCLTTQRALGWIGTRNENSRYNSEFSCRRHVAA